jgi:hypothetical protein
VGELAKFGFRRHHLLSHFQRGQGCALTGVELARTDNTLADHDKTPGGVIADK